MIDPGDREPADFVASRIYDHLEGGGGPSILYITNKFRRVPDSGGAMREYELLRRLVARYAIHYVAVTESFDEEREFLDAPTLGYRSVTLVRTEDVAAHGVPERVRVHASRHARPVVEELIREHSPVLVHVVGYFLAVHLPENLGCPLVLQEENIEFQLARDRASVISPIGDADDGEALERSVWRRSDLCITVAEEDSEVVREELAGDRVICIPNGISRRSWNLQFDAALAPRFLFVANYSWAPSLDAAFYLLEEIWPEIRRRCPEGRLMLAGSGMQSDLQRTVHRTPGALMAGAYANYESLLQPSPIFLSPLRFGGGNKMKIAEALCAGLPIVATSLSLRGYSPTVRDAVMIADKASTFIDAAAELLLRPALRKDLARRARLAARSLCTWDALADRHARLWADVIGCPPVHARKRSSG